MRVARSRGFCTTFSDGLDDLPYEEAEKLWCDLEFEYNKRGGHEWDYLVWLTEDAYASERDRLSALGNWVKALSLFGVTERGLFVNHQSTAKVQSAGNPFAALDQYNEQRLKEKLECI